MWTPPKSIEPKLTEINKKNVPYFQKEIEIQNVIRGAYFAECKHEQQILYSNVARNFSWLCKIYGTTRKKVLFDIQNTLGMTINPNAFKEGTKLKLKSFAAPMMIAKYFNVSGKDMIFSDLETISSIVQEGVKIGDI